MEKANGNVHPTFDLDFARRAYRSVKEELSGEQIASPFDLYSVEELRDRHELRTGEGVPTDVFVWGKGKPAKPQITKVSGIPFWSMSKPWPKDEDGKPCLFLAQFNFADSKKLLPTLPGDILLLFVPDNGEQWLYEEDQISFHWLKASLVKPITSLPKGAGCYSPSEFYGVIYRTADYPETIEAAGKLDVEKAYNLPILNATKIGGVPHFIQSGNPLSSDGIFLGQLASIQAAPEVNYPWTNEKKALGLEFDDSGIYGESNQCIFSDMGSILSVS